MLGTALVVLVLLFAVQILLVVKLADKLTTDAGAGQDDRRGNVQAAGRYAHQVA